MNKTRPSLGFGEELDDFNPEAWQPAPSRAADAAEVRDIRRVAEAAGFKSREPAAKPAPLLRSDRRRRTGRSAQFNLKARPQTIAAFCAIADSMGWGLGETLEKAVLLLEREYGEPKIG